MERRATAWGGGRRPDGTFMVRTYYDDGTVEEAITPGPQGDLIIMPRPGV